MADPKTIVLQLRHIQPGQQWSTRRGNPLRFLVWAGEGQTLDGTLQLAVELHPQSASGGTEPLAAATVELPTGESATVDFDAEKMALDLGGLKALTVKVVVVRVDEGGDPDTILTGSLIVEGNPSSAQMLPGGPVYLYATTSLLAAEVAARQELGEDVGEIDAQVGGIDGRLETVEEQLATLMHVPMAITSLTNSVGTVEIGTVVTSVTLNWATNKEPATLSLNQGIGSVDPDSIAITRAVNLTADTTYTLTADDGTQYAGHSATASTTVQFRHRMYWGVVATDAAPTSADILALASSAYGTGRQREITVNPPPEGAFPAFAHPASWGEPTIMDGSFESTNWERVEINLQKLNGNVTPYLWFRLRDRQYTTGAKFQIT